jgi:ribose transport system permease protein
LATIVVALALWLYYRYSRAGRAMLAVGGNREAAELSGMSPRRSVLLAHVLSGGLAAVAGVMAAAQLHQADPLMATNWLIESFTVAIVGGTLLTGGVVSIAGVVVSGIVLAMISDILILLNVNAYWVTLIQGALVFIAVMIGRATVWPALLRAIRLPVRS